MALQATYLSTRRRNEQLKQLLLKTAAELARAPSAGESSVASWLLRWAGALNRGNERLELLELLKPVHARRLELDPLWGWERQALEALERMGRTDEVFARLEKLVAAYPFQVQTLMLLEKQTDGTVVQRSLMPVRFVPLTRAE